MQTKINNIYYNKYNWERLLYKLRTNKPLKSWAWIWPECEARWTRSKMAMKATFFLLLLGISGILEVQAASLAAENEIWKNLDEGLPCFLFFFKFIEILEFL